LWPRNSSWRRDSRPWNSQASKAVMNRRTPKGLVRFDFGSVIGLSTEVMDKLKRIRPHSLGQASRISGVTPAAISILMVNLKKQGHL